MFNDQEAVLGEFQDGDQQAAGEAIYKDVAKGAAAPSGGGVWSRGHGVAMIAEECKLRQGESETRPYNSGFEPRRLFSEEPECPQADQNGR